MELDWFIISFSILINCWLLFVRCECRKDMRWNTAAGECQLYLDVDCSKITYDTKPSPVVLAAVNSTLEQVEAKNITTDPTNTTLAAVNSTLTPEQAELAVNTTLSNSILTSIG